MWAHVCGVPTVSIEGVIYDNDQLTAHRSTFQIYLVPKPIHPSHTMLVPTFQLHHYTRQTYISPWQCHNYKMHRKAKSLQLQVQVFLMQGQQT